MPSHQILPRNSAFENWWTSEAQGKLHRESPQFITKNRLIEECERALVAAVPICAERSLFRFTLEVILYSEDC
jgi:hypothetical protein